MKRKIIFGFIGTVIGMLVVYWIASPNMPFVGVELSFFRFFQLMGGFLGLALSQMLELSL